MQEKIDLPDEFLLPNYANGSIANVPATIAALLHVPFAGLAPLPDNLWQPLNGPSGGDVQRVVLLIVDSLGWQLVQKERPFFEQITAGTTVVFDQITSIFPSTTVAALSSLWTGYGPAQHGLVGLNLLTPKYGTLTQFISFTPIVGYYQDALVEAGLAPETFLSVPGFSEQLAAAGVPTYRFKGQEIMDSALSRMHGRGVAHSYGVVSPADMFVQMRQVLQERAGERLYMAAYWPTVDKLMHLYGWDHPAVVAEAKAILRQWRLELLDQLSAAARANTIFCLVADHGQVICPAEQYIKLWEHPDLEKMLLLRPSGEPRVPYFHVRHGRQADVLDYLHTHLGHALVALPAQDALAAGLLGPEPHSPDAAERIGDVVGIMRHDYAFLTEAEYSYAHKMRGRHGGMTQLEMRVPWVGLRLD